ncbi:MAG: hypothetical protein LBU41_04565, partial [Clostridiales Family XIII bacterium]|nr:hypothetical protein [Clostridiales Family XIII bacterium]
MNATITIKDLLLFLLCGAGIVLIVYLIILVKHLIVTLKSANIVLKDVETISSIAAKRSQDVDEIVGDVVDTVGALAKNVSGNQGFAKIIASLVGFLTSL